MTFSLFELAEALEVIGSVLVGWAALRVHHRVLNQHRINKKVFRIMKLEQSLGTLGIVLIVLGYFLQRV